jgi:hypothetical protein
MRIAFALLAVIQLLACAGVPGPPRAGLATVWGQIRLVPPSGVAQPTGGASYGDRRFASAHRVDYSKPGFVVVHAEGPSGAYEVAGQSTAPSAEIVIRDGRIGVRLDPGRMAVGAGGSVSITNRSDKRHIVSCPRAGLVRAVEAGAVLEVSLIAAGAYECFVVDVPGAHSTVYAAPGPFAVVSASGRFAIPDLPPGPTVFTAWHPRLPPTRRTVKLTADQLLRLDLEVGVGLQGRNEEP